MSGGINAWNGLVTEGAYESGMAYFSAASRAEELISLSWALEDGNRTFYERVSAASGREEAALLFRELGRAEERHKEALRSLYASITGTPSEPPPPEGMAAGGYLEGGSPLEEALAWASGKSPEEILEFGVAMESHSFDRYVKMSRAVADPQSAELFRTLSGEEKVHLERMTSLLERRRRNG
ncbi:MAG: ferritin family protein [Verrucomicrobiota bacterium]